MAMLVSSFNIKESSVDLFRLQGSPKKETTKGKTPSTLVESHMMEEKSSSIEKQQSFVERHSYVPSFPAAESQLPTMTNLINSSVRFHLKPTNSIEEERHLQQMATAIDDAAKNCVFEDNDIDVEDMEDGLGGALSGRSSKPILDLGTVHLQRIISQLQGLKHSMAHTDFKFDPTSSRRAGLNSYCEYLRGSGVIQQNTMKEEMDKIMKQSNKTY